MKQQELWRQLLDAVAIRKWDHVEELANALLEWLRDRGDPPQTVSRKGLNRGWPAAGAELVCYMPINSAADARCRKKRGSELWRWKTVCDTVGNQPAPRSHLRGFFRLTRGRFAGQFIFFAESAPAASLRACQTLTMVAQQSPPNSDGMTHQKMLHNVLYAMYLARRFFSSKKMDDLPRQAIVPASRQLTQPRMRDVPVLFVQAGERATRRVLEFFTAQIRNPNTRAAYGRAIQHFAETCERSGITLGRIEPIIVAAYVERLGERLSKPTVKQHLAAIRMLFDWLVIGQIVPMNPASSVRGPKHIIRKGKTPVLSANEARELIDAIDITKLSGLRDRALIGVMVYSFGRVGAVVKMNVEDYYQQGKRCWFRLQEKGGKRHEVPAHHNAEFYLDEYLAAAGIANDKKGPIFRTFDRRRHLSDRRMHRNEVLAMVKRRARAVGLPTNICCHTWRATGLTAYLSNGGLLEHAQQIAGHESPRTTKLYDRTTDRLSLDEIERIVI
jgi:site-specific recombinase XerD